MQEQIEILKQCSFCQDLPPATLNELARIAVRQRYPARQLIQFEGDPAEAMYIVAEGLVKISRIGSNGREQVLNVIGPGGHFNTVPIFDNGLCPANAEALSDLQLLILPRQAMRSLIERQPSLALALLGEFAGRLRHLVNLVDELALHSVQGRLAGLLLRQAEAAERGEISPALTQAEIAARLGTVREMVARTLKSFEIQGAIKLERGAITILDRELLAEIHEE
jgi:cAMP-binding proteins - catabolite gene activator and regulatory subunit of cAMP-dependent protein kinases